MESGAIIETKSLDVWHLEDGTGSWTPMNPISDISKVAHHPGLRLSPAMSIIVDFLLPQQMILKLMKMAPQVEQVSVQFRDEACVRQKMDNIFMISKEDDKYLCPKMKALTLVFHWDVREVEFWVHRAALAVDGRRKLSVSLAIYGRWKGEASHKLLA